MFDPVRLYDKPSVLLTQVGNGVSSMGAIRRTLFEPSALSPIERQSFTDGLKDSLGNTAVGDAVVDVLANPVSWMAFLMHGGGVAVENFARTGRMFAGSYGEWTTKKHPALRAMRVLSMSQELHGTPVPHLVETGARVLSSTARELSESMTPTAERVLDAVSRKHGVRVRSFEPEAAPNAASEHDMNRLSSAIFARLYGYDKPHESRHLDRMVPARLIVERQHLLPDGTVQWIRADGFDEAMRATLERQQHTHWLHETTTTSGAPGWAVTSEPGPNARRFRVVESDVRQGLQPEIRTTARGAWMDPAKVDAVLSEFDAHAHVEAVRGAMLRMKVMRYGDEAHYAATGTFRPDDAKILRTARGVVGMAPDRMFGRDGRLLDDGAHTLNMLLSDEFARRTGSDTGGRLNEGMTRAQAEATVVGTMKLLIEDEHYMPRNTRQSYEPVGAGGRRKVRQGHFSMDGDLEEMSSPSGRSRMRTMDQASFDSQQLQFIRDTFGSTPELELELARSRLREAQMQASNPRGRWSVMRIAPHEAVGKYVATTARDHLLHGVDPMAHADIRVALADHPVPASLSVRLPGPPGEEGHHVSERIAGIPVKGLPSGGLSYNDLLQAHLRAVEEAEGGHGYVGRTMRQHVLPSVLGYRPLEDGAAEAAHDTARALAGRIADSKFMRMVESHGGVAERFVRSMRRFADEPWEGGSWGRGVAKMFYGSTMGLNLSSALMNLMQPIHNLHQLGPRNVARAYAQSIGQMWDFVRERAALGPRPHPSAVEEAMKRAMRRTLAGGLEVDLRDVADLGSSWAMVERPGYAAQVVGGAGGVGFFEAIMKPFQLAESLNRLVTANSVFNAAERGWEAASKRRGGDQARAVQEARMAVEAMQFGGSAMNRPAIFYKDFLSNPAIRQFLQFPVRSAVNLATMPGMVGGGRRVGLGPLSFGVEHPLGVTAVDAMRALGWSAVAYEALKGLAGVDASDGLLLGFVPSLDPDRQTHLNMPVPPFMDAGFQVARSVMSGGDAEVLSDVVPLLFPGGVAIARALGSMPRMDAVQSIGMQKRYADWGNVDKDGNVPLFDQDGRYLGAWQASDVVLRGLGADMGRFRNQGEATAFLLKNRDEMRDLRRRWIAATLAGSHQAAASTKAEYERRFGVPLTVERRQIEAAVRMRESSVAERTLSTIDAGAREGFRQEVERGAPAALVPGPAQDPGDGVVLPDEQGDRYRWSIQAGSPQPS